MYLQEILEVAIGLMIMWLVLSIAAMTLQEWIGNVFNSRARDLERTIAEMLNSRAMAKQLYNHPLISSLYRGSQNPNKKARLPSYLPPAKFASALFELVVGAGANLSPFKNITPQINHALAENLSSPEQLKQALNDWQTVVETGKQVIGSGAGQASIDTLRMQIQAFGRKYPELQPSLEEILPPVFVFLKEYQDEERTVAPAGTEVDPSMRQFRLGLKVIGGPNPRLKAALSAMMRDAQITLLDGDQAAAKVRQQIETWFNDTMDRLTGAYKRKAQFDAFLIGIFLAVILNVDSINASLSLWREPTLRQAIIAQVRDFTASQSAIGSTSPDTSTVGSMLTIPQLQMQLQALNFPFGWTSGPVVYDQMVACDLTAPSAYDPAGNPTRLLGLHIRNVCVPLVNAQPFNLNNLSGWITKLLGLLITGAAAAQGAPFWFDILKKFINVRGTGEKPVETTAVG